MAQDDMDAPLYAIEDEVKSPAEADAGDAIYNFDDVDDDDSGADDSEEDDADLEESEDAEPDAEVKKGPSPVGVLFKAMLTPVEGWKALKRARFKTEDFAARCFYPLIALSAVSEVASLFYEANRTFSDWVMDGLATFITFFFGYFTIIALGSMALPKKSRSFLQKDIGRQFVMLNLSTLAMFWVLIQALPMLEPVLVFLPLWTIYLIFKGVRVLRIPEDVTTSTTGYLCLLIIGIPVLWNWLLTEFLLPAV